MSIRQFPLLLSLILSTFPHPTARAETLDLGTSKLTIDPRGIVTSVTFADGAKWPSTSQPAFFVEASGQICLPIEVQKQGEQWRVRFEHGVTAEFRVTTGQGFAVFRLTKLEPKKLARFRLFSLAAPAGAQVASTLNGASHQGHFAAVMVAEPNVRPVLGQSGGSKADRPGCSHEFVRVDDAKSGSHAARFTATSDAKPGGWSMRGQSFPLPRDLTGCKAIRAWVHGDGKGQALKIQLFDGAGGYRDDYLTIDFKGWRHVTLAKPALDTLKYHRASALNFYYNSLPPGQTVACLIDQVEAVLQRDGSERVELLEDFEAADSPLWSSPVVLLGVETASDHGLEPAAFGVIACPEAERFDVIERFELASGLPCPRPGGAWNKKSPWIKRSYFFLTDFREWQFDEALAIARRGGFHMILLGQESWSLGTGHYQINRDRFPDGLEGLKRTFDRFREHGFHVGLHFLGPSIYPPDPYLVPVPDPRLVKGATATLAADIDDKAQFLPSETPPDKFPNEDGGYEGDGTVIQIGDELIWYGKRSMEKPYGFAECRRGHLGTKAAAHKKGDRVSHLVRSYGYHMFDMDTSLLDEVAGHFAKVANTCGVEMIYFDGSERLQGDHWYYNAKLHKAFYDKLATKDILLQASSFSPYSWHILARSASADGHGDLKGYLDERSPGFEWLAREGMPLDIGWYYGYDPMSTPDQYEYILGATIGYDSSMSFQVSCAAAARHPFTGEILDLIARYEKLRLSGRVPEEMRKRLRIDPSLGGKKEPEARAKLLDRRREYRLLGPEGHQHFQRVVYQPWHEVKSPDAGQTTWTVRVSEPRTRIGVQIHAMSGPWLDAGPAYRAADALLLESFDDLAPYTRDPKNRREVRVIEHGQSGSTSPGVTQRLEIREDGPRQGRRFALYTAESADAGVGGWSVVGKSFDPPLDLSWHKGIGFWLRGDGRGGAFKLQLTDGRRATDYYITNDFVGWRYQQLARPEKDPIDYAKVRTLMFYYNGLPGKTTVSCGIDDVKALRALDEQALTDPWVEISGQRWEFSGRLTAGQYVFFWPGEPITRYGLPLKQPEILRQQAASVVLPPGEYPVRLGCRGALALPARARVTLQPPERHAIP
jgi:hypothetical protein